MLHLVLNDTSFNTWTRISKTRCSAGYFKRKKGEKRKAGYLWLKTTASKPFLNYDVAIHLMRSKPVNENEIQLESVV